MVSRYMIPTGIPRVDDWLTGPGGLGRHRHIPFKKVEQKDVIQFIHRFGIPQSITINQGTMFTRDEMTYFAKDYGIQFIDPLPFMPKQRSR